MLDLSKQSKWFGFASLELARSCLNAGEQYLFLTLSHFFCYCSLLENLLIDLYFWN